MKFRKKINLSVITILAGLFFVFSASSVYALYYQYGYSLYSMTYAVKTSGADNIYATAASNWKKAVGTNITKSSTSANRVWTGNYPYKWFGLYQPTVSGGKNYYFDIKLDLTNIANYGPHRGKFNEATISSATHEFGHAQFLDDYTNSRRTTSIMSHQRDRTKMTKPQKHDIDNIQAYRAR